MDIEPEVIELLAKRLIQIWQEGEIPYSIRNVAEESLKTPLITLPVWGWIATEVERQIEEQKTAVATHIAASITEAVATHLASAYGEITKKVMAKVNERIY